MILIYTLPPNGVPEHIASVASVAIAELVMIAMWKERRMRTQATEKETEAFGEILTGREAEQYDGSKIVVVWHCPRKRGTV